MNDAPVVTSFEWSVMEDDSTEILLQGYDADGHELTFFIYDGVGHGSTQLDGNTVTYIPNENYSGPDSFSYYAFDGAEDNNYSDTVVVSLTIIPVNDPPTVSDVVFDNVTDGYQFTLDADDVDDDPTISFVPMDNGTFFGGSVADNGDGSFTYSMGTNTSNQDFILYKAVDSLSESSLGLITFNIPEGTVFAGRGAPIALDDAVEVTEDIAKAISFVGFDADTAFSGDAFVTITQPPTNGSIDNEVLIEDGVDELAQWTLTYTPGLDYSGTDTIKFTVNNPGNPESESGEAAISITVNAENDLPIISSVENQTIEEDESLILIVDATDADNSLTLSHVSNDTVNFEISLVNDTLLVTPAPNYSGTATITLTATENGGENAQISESFNVIVTPVNDIPQMTSVEDTVTTMEDEIFSLILSADDVEGDDLSYALVEETPEGMIITGSTIEWSSPENDDVGEYTVYAMVFEASSPSASDTVSFVLTVENVNDTPDITVDSYPGEIF